MISNTSQDWLAELQHIRALYESKTKTMVDRIDVLEKLLGCSERNLVDSRRMAHIQGAVINCVQWDGQARRWIINSADIEMISDSRTRDSANGLLVLASSVKEAK